jgi:hypothetical protein
MGNLLTEATQAHQETEEQRKVGRGQAVGRGGVRCWQEEGGGGADMLQRIAIYFNCFSYHNFLLVCGRKVLRS